MLLDAHANACSSPTSPCTIYQTRAADGARAFMSAALNCLPVRAVTAVRSVSTESGINQDLYPESEFRPAPRADATGREAARAADRLDRPTAAVHTAPRASANRVTAFLARFHIFLG